MSDADKLTKAVVHYQQALEHYARKGNDAKMLHCIFKLFNMPITTAHLEQTGIGRTVNSLRKHGEEVGDAAKTLVAKWKQMVSAQDEDSSESADNTITDTNIHSENKSDTKEKRDDNRSNSSHRDSEKDKSHIKSDRKEKPDRSVREKNKHGREVSRTKHTERRSRSKETHRSSAGRKSEDKSEDEDKDRSESDNNSDSDRANDRDRSASDDGTSGFEEEDSSRSDESQRSRSRSHSRERHSTERSKSESKTKNKQMQSRNKPEHSSSHSRDKSHSKESSRESKSRKSGHRDRSSSKDRSKSSHSRERDHKNRKSSKSRDRSRSKDKDRSSKRHDRKRNHASSDSSDSEQKLKKQRHGDRKLKDRKKRKHESSSDEDDDSDDGKDYRQRKQQSSDAKVLETKSQSRHDLKKEDGKKSKNEKKERESKHLSSSKKHSDKPKDKEKDRYSSGRSGEKDKERRNSIKDVDKKSEKSSSGNSNNSKSKPSGQIALGAENGICSGHGASFAEALGMLEPTTSKGIKKSKSIPRINTEKVMPEKSEIERERKPPKIEVVIPPPPPKAEPIDINISSLLPPITPNYRPLGNVIENIQNARSKVLNEDEALSMVLTSKNLRTKVYSGNKCLENEVPSLFELCIRVLQDNIDDLDYTGGVPYLILKPVLEKATADQLFVVEHHNPYLIEDTDGIWQLHCQKEFRNKRREELESWREMYMRCLDEREAKLKTLMANIKQSQDNSTPVRKTQLAYVDSVAKPPRNIARKQAKNGIDRKPMVTPSSRLNALAASGAAVTVPNPGSRASSSGGGGGSSAHIKPKKAPLMQKTLALLKGGRYRR